MVQKAHWRSQQKIQLHSKVELIDTIMSKLSTEHRAHLFEKGWFVHMLDIKIKKFQAQVYRHLMVRQCQPQKDDELCFNFEGEVVCFTMKDFALVTGLNCGDYPPVPIRALPEGNLKKKFFKNHNAVTRKMISDTFEKKKCNDDDLIKLAKVHILENLLLGKSDHTNIYLNHLNMVDNDELFDKYPWDRLSYEMTIDSVKNGLNYIHSDTCNATGFPFALLVWAYETIPALVGKEYVKKLGNNIPKNS